MTATSSRLLELLSLLQARRDWLGSELAGQIVEIRVEQMAVNGQRERGRAMAQD